MSLSEKKDKVLTKEESERLKKNRGYQKRVKNLNPLTDIPENFGKLVFFLCVRVRRTLDLMPYPCNPQNVRF